jgi:hypothetical protein
MAWGLLFYIKKFRKEDLVMRKMVLVGLVAALGLALGGIAYAEYWGGYGGHMMSPGYGGYMMGPGYANNMMGPGYGNCWSNTPGTYKGKPVTQKDTEAILKDYVGGNPNLKVGEITDKGTYFEGTIVTKDNSLVARYGIDKDSGWVRPIN